MQELDFLNKNELKNLNFIENEEFKKASKKSKENAKYLFDAIYKKYPNYLYDVLFTGNKEISIDVKIKKGVGILILCNFDGSINYHSTENSENSYVKSLGLRTFPFYIMWNFLVKPDREIK